MSVVWPTGTHPERERYYVIEVRGVGIRQYGGGQTGSSFSILDRYYCHREVDTFYSPRPVDGQSRRRERAYRECDRLNALDKAQGVI